LVTVKKDEEIIGNRIKVANTFFTRLVGLLGKKTLQEGEGLLLIPCRQIHTYLMSMPLDVLFLNKKGEILDLYPEMAPGRLSSLVKEGYQVLELPSGTIRLKKLKKGDCLEIIWEYY
jgi:uncharacterized membrane protein (UPF0127 family)